MELGDIKIDLVCENGMVVWSFTKNEVERITNKFFFVWVMSVADQVEYSGFNFDFGDISASQSRPGTSFYVMNALCEHVCLCNENCVWAVLSSILSNDVNILTLISKSPSDVDYTWTELGMLLCFANVLNVFVCAKWCGLVEIVVFVLNAWCVCATDCCLTATVFLCWAMM